MTFVSSSSRTIEDQDHHVVLAKFIITKSEETYSK